MRRAALVCLFLTSAMPVLAATQEVSLSLDEVHTVTFKSPVATVYVGNPAIADITMIDARHAFVQGKAYGRTNIVALNKDGGQVFNTGVNVMGAQNSGTVILNRGAQRITLNCSGNRCEPTPMPGDGKGGYDPADAVTSQHQASARAAASAASTEK